jgi:hypothetical protein
MAEAAAQIEEQISPERQSAGWKSFVQFHAQTVNNKYSIDAAVPAPVAKVRQTQNDGWRGKDSTVVFPTTADDVADGNTKDEADDDTDEVDSAQERKWLKAIFSLLGGSSHAVAAKEAGVSNRQLSRYKSNPEFVALFQKTKDQVFRESVNGMKGVLTAAGIVGAKALQEIAEDKDATDTARVAAARALTQLALEINDLEKLASDIAALKAVRE